MRQAFPTLAIVAVLVLAGSSATLAASATVTANFAAPLATIQTEYGMNEVDRATYFAGLTPYPNMQILANHREMGTKRIRVFYRNDWSQSALDSLISAVIECNAVPMVCFQYVPAGMSNSAWGDWCAAAVTRYKAVYDISDWMWEIINEPNLTGFTSATYTALFTAVEPKIHAAYPAAMVGGPGSAGLETSWISALYASASANNIQFISWHRYGGWYPGPDWPSDSTILSQLPYYDSDLNTAYNLLPSGKKSTKLILGEFNVNAWAGDVNGVWSTDPRIKTIFNAVFYAAVLKRMLYSSQGRQLACEMHWEGTGDDTPGGPPGFGMWYSQEPLNRTPAYYAKRAIAASFPYGATLVSTTRTGSAAVEAFACTYGSPAVNSVVIINESTSTSTVQVVLQNSTFTSGQWLIIDAANPTGYSVPASGATHSLTLNGYAVAVLGTPSAQTLAMTSGPTVIEGATTATVQWTTNLPSYSKVSYGPTTTYGSVANDPALKTQHSITLTGLTPYANYRFRVESGGPGLTAVQSADGNFWAPRPAGSTIGQAKSLPNGSQVYLFGKIVTSLQPSDGCIYIEEPDRSSGVRVVATGDFGVGQVVDAYGPVSARVLSGMPAERQVAATVNPVPTAPAPVEPVALTSRAIGGGPAAYHLGVVGGTGLNNFGLLITYAGKVTSKNGSYLWIDDGTAIPDYNGNTGVMVKIDGSSPAFEIGDMVRVTGVIEGSIPLGFAANRRFIQTRGPGDVAKVE